MAIFHNISCDLFDITTIYCVQISFSDGPLFADLILILVQNETADYHLVNL